MKSKIYLFLIFAFFMQTGFSQSNEVPKSTQDILASAQKVAAEQGKNVFLMWHASWCGWCHLMDSLMNRDDLKSYFTDNYVIEHLVVKESKDNKHLENPGAADLLAKYNGDKAGIPFWIVLDKNGKLLADSYMRPEGLGMDQPGTNTGCPAQKGEVDHFIKVLKTTSEISDEGLTKIAGVFLKK